MSITKEDLENYANDYPNCMFVIYANWCGHCQTMKEKLGKYFNLNYDIIMFLEESEISNDLKDYFPHIHVYENGVRRDGSLDELYDWIDNFKQSEK